MADRTMSTTPLQELGLTVATEVFNDRELPKDKDGNPINPKSTEQYLLDRWNEVLDSYVRTHRDTIYALCDARWPKLTDAQRQKILTDLSVPELAGAPVDVQRKLLAKYGIDAFVALPEDKQIEDFGIIMSGD